MLIWLFVYSMGQHLVIPLNSSIGMELAREGGGGQAAGAVQRGKELCGHRRELRGLSRVQVPALHIHDRIRDRAVGFLVAGIAMYQPHPAGVHPRLYREHGLYYWLSILYGTRKQMFLTFAPWVLVTVFKQPTAMVATLLTIGGSGGVFFQPILGKAIDRLGERFVLTAEAVVLVFVCLGYGFSKAIFGPHLAFIIAAGCYLTDQLLMSVGMARATYMKKIALDPAHVTSTLTMSVSIDPHLLHCHGSALRAGVETVGLSGGVSDCGGDCDCQYLLGVEGQGSPSEDCPLCGLRPRSVRRRAGGRGMWSLLLRRTLPQCPTLPSMQRQALEPCAEVANPQSW